MNDEKVFCDGMIVKAPSENAPEWLKLKVSIKVEEFVGFLEAHTKGDGWVNLDIKESKGGKLYAQLNQWSKEQSVERRDAEDDKPPF